MKAHVDFAPCDKDVVWNSVGSGTLVWIEGDQYLEYILSGGVNR